MAAVEVFNSDFDKIECYSLHQILNRVQKLERCSFPKHEALNLELELRKRSTKLVVIAEHGTSSKAPTVNGYMVLARQKQSVWLHKICVAKEFRRHGIGKKMLSHACAELLSSGCQKMILWVDPERKAAVSLYESAGFVISKSVKDYYSQGRDGVNMKLDISIARTLASANIPHSKQL